MLLLVWHIRADEAVNAYLLAALEESVVAVLEYRVQVGHKAYRDIGVLANLLGKFERTVGGHAVAERADICVLDHGTFRDGVAERNAYFNEVCAALYHCHDVVEAVLKCRISGGEEADKCFFILKCVMYLIHEDLSPCILQ